MTGTLLRSTILAILAAGATACVTRPEQGPVRLGQAAALGGPVARPIKLIEDSRCPANARCIRAGRVVVRTELRTGGGRRTLDLTLGDPQNIADGQITLISVTPERYAGRPIRPGDYRFVYEFAGGL